LHIERVFVFVAELPFEQAARQRIGNVNDIAKLVNRAENFARLIVIAHGFDDFLGHVERKEDAFANAFVPAHNQMTQGIGTAAQVFILGCAIEHVKSADIMHQASQHGFVRIDMGFAARDHFGGASGSERMRPQMRGQLFKTGDRAHAPHLVHGDRQRNIAHHPQTQTNNRRFCIHHHRATLAIRRRIGQAQQFRVDQRFQRDLTRQLFQGDVFIFQ